MTGVELSTFAGRGSAGRLLCGLLLAAQ